jgi:hypothetical protein
LVAIQTGLLRGEQAECRPVEFRIATRNAGDQTIAQDANRRHGHASRFYLGERQAHVLEGEREDETAGCVMSPSNLVAVNPVNAAAKHRSREDG